MTSLITSQLSFSTLKILATVKLQQAQTLILAVLVPLRF